MAKKKLARRERREDARKVVLDRAALDLHKFAQGAKETPGRYSLAAIHVTRKQVEATDGRILVALPSTLTENFPKIKGATDLPEKGDLLLEATDAKETERRLSKNGTELAQSVQVGRKEDSITLAMMDSGGSLSVRSVPNMKGLFPDTALFLETPQPKKTIILAAHYLRKIADYAQKHSTSDDQTVVFELSGEEEAVHIRVNVSQNRTAHIVLMPVLKRAT